MVLNQNDLLQISKSFTRNSLEGVGVALIPRDMDFTIMPSADNLPLTTMTENAQYKLNLSWEPQNIKSGSTTTFYFDISDAFFLDRQVAVSYDLSVFHDGKEIAQASGFSTDLGLNTVKPVSYTHLTLTTIYSE